MTKPERQPPRPKKRHPARQPKAGPPAGLVAGGLVALLVAGGAVAVLLSGRKIETQAHPPAAPAPGPVGALPSGVPREREAQAKPPASSREDRIEERARRWAADVLRPGIERVQRARGEVDQASVNAIMAKEVERQRPGARLLEDCYDLADQRADKEGQSREAWRKAVERVWLQRRIREAMAASGGATVLPADRVLSAAANEVAAGAVERRALDSLDR